jgi:hypothetical protein
MLWYVNIMQNLHDYLLATTRYGEVNHGIWEIPNELIWVLWLSSTFPHCLQIPFYVGAQMGQLLEDLCNCTHWYSHKLATGWSAKMHCGSAVPLSSTSSVTLCKLPNITDLVSRFVKRKELCLVIRCGEDLSKCGNTWKTPGTVPDTWCVFN